jgi:hypothetical protein
MVHLIYGEKCSVYIVLQALVPLKQLKADLYTAESYAAAQGSPTPCRADRIPMYEGPVKSIALIVDAASQATGIQLPTGFKSL